MRFTANALVLAALLCLTSCSDPERNVILATEPFLTVELAFEPSRSDLIVDSVRHFSEAHQMQFMLARRSLPPGNFNASALNSDLNLRAIHVEPLDRGVVLIYATARGGRPSPSQQQLANDFLEQVRSASRPGAGLAAQAATG